jgi:hypothetical protein
MLILPVLAWLAALAVTAAIAAWNWQDIEPLVSSAGATLALAFVAVATAITAGWLLREVARKS